MIDEGIFDGDTVIIRKQNTVEDGETAVALINNNEVTLKRFTKKRIAYVYSQQTPTSNLYVKEVIIQGKVISTFRNIEEQERKDNGSKLNKIYRSDCIEFMKSIDENLLI